MVARAMIIRPSLRQYLLVHAEGTLGLVEDRLVAATLVGVLLAAGLVLKRLAGALLAVWLDVALSHVR